MLNIQYLRENIDYVKEKYNQRRAEVDWERFGVLDAQRRELIGEVEEMRAERNRVSQEIANLKRQGKHSEAEQEILRMRKLGDKIRKSEESLRVWDEKLQEMLLTFPNLPHPSVPIGKDAAANPVIRSWGAAPEFKFKPKDHVELGEILGIIDLPRAAKISGARFCLYRGAGAQLERALAAFMLDLHTREHGYLEVLPPYLVSRESMLGTGQLPKFGQDLFKTDDGDGYYLIPTAEVPVTNIHRDEIIDEDELPLRYVAHTPCFRREAGSHGKDVRGIIRQHQFNKVELVKFSKPEESYRELESLTANAEEVLRRLELPYRVVALCTADLGFSAAKTYDIEVWLPSQRTYREISSCSNFEEFQARRAKIRFRRKGNRKTAFLHTLNGSGLAVGRTLVALLENYQQPDGSVVIPKALRPYMNGLERLS